jgi:ankyrin repeat protein
MGKRMRELQGYSAGSTSSGFSQPVRGAGKASAGLAALLLEDLRAGNLGALSSRLRHGAPAHYPDLTTGWTLLHEATVLSARDAIEVLLRHDAQPGHPATGVVTTTLDWLIADGGTKTMVVATTTDAGGSSGDQNDPNDQNVPTSGPRRTRLRVPALTALHLAAALPESAPLSLLVARYPAGAGVACGRGWTPLMYAAEAGVTDNVQILVDAGDWVAPAAAPAAAAAAAAPAADRDSGGGGAKKSAGGGKPGSAGSASEPAAGSTTTSVLGQRGSQGETAAHVAAGAGRIDVLRLLKKLGADMEAKDGRGETPLFYAARHRGVQAEDVLEFLLLGK